MTSRNLLAAGAKRRHFPACLSEKGRKAFFSID
jgi:hypothetical protein